MQATMNNQQHATVIAALRYYQHQGMGDPANRSDEIHDIATNMDEETSLDSDGIDDLVEHLQFNTSENGVNAQDAKDIAKTLKGHLKAVGVDIKHAQALDAVARLGGVKEWRAMMAKINSCPTEIVSEVKIQPRVLITVSGGIAEWVCDDGVRVQHFDWDNYNQEDEAGQDSMALPESFRDLAEPMGIPTESDIAAESKGIAPATPGSEQLPEMCFAFVSTAAPGNYVVAIKRGESGYFKTHISESDPGKAELLVSHLNNKLGISWLQADCMLNGSMFGWNTPGAQLSADKKAVEPEKTPCVECGLPTVVDDNGLCNRCAEFYEFSQLNSLEIEDKVIAAGHLCDYLGDSIWLVDERKYCDMRDVFVIVNPL